MGFGKVGVHYLNHCSLFSVWLFIFCKLTMNYSALTVLCLLSHSNEGEIYLGDVSCSVQLFEDVKIRTKFKI